MCLEVITMAPAFGEGCVTFLANGKSSVNVSEPKQYLENQTSDPLTVKDTEFQRS